MLEVGGEVWEFSGAGLQALTTTGKISVGILGGLAGWGLFGNCFPATTKITLANGDITTIDKIKVGDEVQSFNPHFNSKNATLVSSKVTRLFENVTQEWLQLSNGTIVTSGHHFLNENGMFEMIGNILERKGQIVSANDNYKIQMVA